MDHRHYVAFRKTADRKMQLAARLFEVGLAWGAVDPVMSARQFRLGTKLAEQAEAMQKWIREGWRNGT